MRQYLITMENCAKMKLLQKVKALLRDKQVKLLLDRIIKAQP